MACCQRVSFGATFIYSVIKIKKKRKQSIVTFWLRLAYVYLVDFQETLGVVLTFEAS